MENILVFLCEFLDVAMPLYKVEKIGFDESVFNIAGFAIHALADEYEIQLWKKRGDLVLGEFSIRID